MRLWIILPVFGFLLGSVPFGLLLTRWRRGMDIRRAGSGNIGATNVMRQAGPLLGVLTLACDAGKGALPVALALAPAAPGREALAAATALCAFLGHLYPVYTRFGGGGKGVATAAGCAAVLCWPALLISLAVFVAVVWICGRVSVGSLAAAASLPVAGAFFSSSRFTWAALFFMSALVWVRHRENISRLRAGTEPRLFRKRP